MEKYIFHFKNRHVKTTQKIFKGNKSKNIYLRKRSHEFLYKYLKIKSKLKNNKNKKIIKVKKVKNKC